MIPGEYKVKPGYIELNIGQATCSIIVENHGDRPIQVGSHYHFAEVNPALKFDRQKASEPPRVSWRVFYL
ncbi:hypothetical protein IAS65_005458, partial [Escherichia coli]|nr:hypothetical protein [Escherichia coli]